LNFLWPESAFLTAPSWLFSNGEWDNKNAYAFGLSDFEALGFAVLVVVGGVLKSYGPATARFLTDEGGLASRITGMVLKA